MEARVDGALVLVGFMGAGKSTGARALAAELGASAVDSDRELELELGEPIEDFFDRQGEAAFRAREEEKVCELLGRGDAAVIALGGGAVQSERVREALARHTVIHLEVDSENAWRRASGRGRPLARDPARFAQLQSDRVALYESVADVMMPPGDRDALRRALPFLTALRDAPAGTRLLWATAESGDYPVFLGRGLIESGWFPPLSGRRHVVTDENVAALHSMQGDTRILLAAGEENKTLGAAEQVLRSLARAGAERFDLVVAVGGGVVGDLAGFCAAVYQRGMRHVQVPTTLVSQVDSAYGGKTAVDLPEGKNYAGAYHQPAAVLCDPAVLDTLPAEEAAAGYAEVVKTALIAGGALWARVRQGEAPGPGEIMGCVRTKLAVVAEDERDGGRRQVLNLGHTVGHAVEAATGYGRYRHGEAVGIGLLAALRLSGREALRAEVADLLAARGLPLSFSGTAVDEVLALIERDKKSEGGQVPFVLVEAPGAVTPGHQVDPNRLRDAVEEVSET
ncbi:MAG TPA: bifunctional shikimate kinase/3-dehydroquinate synthase [Thermoleophilaceae bacterium]|nr:bifunctional shikimate kinase/3-dehydroquinate synthase [Thermoleophilaceae bacterium]